MPGLLSEIRYGSFLVYSPKGKNAVSCFSQRIRDALKQDGTIPSPPKGEPVNFIDRAAERLEEELEGSELAEFFGADIFLVPVPGCAPLVRDNALWVPKRICDALKLRLLGKDVLPCLVRKKAVPKSAFQRGSDRPTARTHFESMGVIESVFLPKRITVVDDIITRGATLLAAYSHLQAAFPEASIRAFALVRTMSNVELQEIRKPHVGTILLRDEQCFRDPKK